MARIDYQLRVLHEYTLAAREVRKLADWATRASPARIATIGGISDARAEVLPMAARMLGELIDHLDPGDVRVSGFGLREGMCFEHLPRALRGLDPLIAACEAQEALRARAPGFGAELAAWVKTLLPPADDAEDRLVEAAARLVDVNWRTHPDYRVTSSWETVTRATITNVGHAGRAFIGAILSARYKRARKALEESRIPELLDARTLDRAVQLGLAFRLGVVLSGASPGVLAGCRAARDDGFLELVLEGDAAELAGEEVEKRLRHLAAEIGVESVLRTDAQGDSSTINLNGKRPA